MLANMPVKPYHVILEVDQKPKNLADLLYGKPIISGALVVPNEDICAPKDGKESLVMKALLNYSPPMINKANVTRFVDIILMKVFTNELGLCISSPYSVSIFKNVSNLPMCRVQGLDLGLASAIKSTVYMLAREYYSLINKDTGHYWQSLQRSLHDNIQANFYKKEYIAWTYLPVVEAIYALFIRDLTKESQGHLATPGRFTFEGAFELMTGHIAKRFPQMMVWNKEVGVDIARCFSTSNHGFRLAIFPQFETGHIPLFTKLSLLIREMRSCNYLAILKLCKVDKFFAGRLDTLPDGVFIHVGSYLVEGYDLGDLVGFSTKV